MFLIRNSSKRHQQSFLSNLPEAKIFPQSVFCGTQQGGSRRLASKGSHNPLRLGHVTFSNAHWEMHNIFQGGALILLTFLYSHIFPAPLFFLQRAQGLGTTF